MWFLKKEKRRLKDCFSNGYADMHSHLLYGLDDGAKTFEDTLSLTESLIGYGFESFVTTPHTLPLVWENTREGILNRGEETVRQLHENGIRKSFGFASEYMMDDIFMQQLEREKLLTLTENLILVEMSYLNPPIQLYTIIYELQLAGYKPVLAHPERYLFYHGHMADYERLKKAGCLFQLNLLSVTGYYGKGVLRCAADLLHAGMVDFTGSDVHHQNHIKAFNEPVLLGRKEADALDSAIRANGLFKLQ